MEEFEIYTDGGYSAPRRTGSWAFIILKAGEPQLISSGRMECSESTEAELIAVIKALDFFYENSKICIKVDCQFVLKAIEAISGPESHKFLPTQKSRKRFWHHLEKLIELTRGHEIDVQWVQSRTSLNRLCDNECRKQLIDIPYEPVASVDEELTHLRRTLFPIPSLPEKAEPRPAKISREERTLRAKQRLYEAHKDTLLKVQALLRERRYHVDNQARLGSTSNG